MTRLDTTIPKVYSGPMQQKYEEADKSIQDENTVQGKEKKGFFGRKEKTAKPKVGLFGKTEKNHLNNKEESFVKPKSFQGIAIPGSDVVPKPDNTIAQQTAIPTQNVTMQVHQAPIQNFGETVDLQSYINATSSQTNSNLNPVGNACLIRKSTGEKFFLTKEVTKVGRSRENVDIYITNNKSIGRVHVILYLRNGHVFVEDQNSKIGTFLNGRRIMNQEEVISGTQIRISDEEFEFVFI